MTLSEERIKAGENLLRQLDAADVHVDAALWFYFPDNENWKLILSLPRFIKQGPKLAYRRVQKALSKLGDDFAISLYDVSIAKPNDPLFQLLKTATKTGPGISHIRFSNNVINGQLIEDVLIYRLN